MIKKLMAVLLSSFVSLALVAQNEQQIPPFRTTYGNFMQGTKINGSWGTPGWCKISTGSGEVWKICPAGMTGTYPGVSSDGNNGLSMLGAIAFGSQSSMATTLANLGGAQLAPNQNSYVLSNNCLTVITNCIQLFMDGKIIKDATANGTNTVTCPNADCNFVQANVGNVVLATTSVNNGLFTTFVCGYTTISAVNSPQSINITNPCIGSGTANVQLIWGHDDGTALAAMDVIAGCAVIHGATSTNMILTSQPFLQHNCFNALTGVMGGPRTALVGDGFGASQLTFGILPNFNWAGCNISDGSGTRQICMGAYARTISNVQMTGFGLTPASNSGCAAGANKIVMAVGGSAVMYGTDLAGICAGETGMVGIEVYGVDDNIDLGGAQDVGQYAGVAYAGQAISMRGNDFQNPDSGGYGLWVTGGAQVSSMSSNPMRNILIDTSSIFSSRDTFYQATSGVPSIEVANTATYVSFNDTNQGLASVGLKVDVGGTAKVTNTTFGGSSSIDNLGAVISGGGNKLLNLATTSAGTWSGVGVIVGSCHGTVTANTSIWLNGAGQSTSSSCTVTTVGGGAPFGTALLSGSLLQLVVTAGTGGVNSSDGIVKVNLNGAFGSGQTCQLGTGTSCVSNGFLVPNPGDSIQISVSTQPASTLANIVATLLGGDW